MVSKSCLFAVDKATGLLEPAEKCPSPNQDARPCGGDPSPDRGFTGSVSRPGSLVDRRSRPCSPTDSTGMHILTLKKFAAWKCQRIYLSAATGPSSSLCHLPSARGMRGSPVFAEKPAATTFPSASNSRARMKRRTMIGNIPRCRPWLMHCALPTLAFQHARLLAIVTSHPVAKPIRDLLSTGSDCMMVLGPETEAL